MLPLERHRLIVELLGQHGVMRVLLYGAMLADELWSGDQRDGERYPDRRLDRGDVDYRRGRNSAGDGHYLGYERRQYANRLYRSAPVLCVCRFLRLLVRA